SGLIKFELLDRVHAAVQSELQKRENVNPLFRDTKTRKTEKAFAGIQFRAVESREKAKSAYQRKEIRGYYIFPSNFLDTGLIELETKKTRFMSDNRPGWEVVQ